MPTPRTTLFRLAPLSLACIASLVSAKARAEDTLRRHYTNPIEATRPQTVVQAGVVVLNAGAKARKGTQLCLAVISIVPGKEPVELRPEPGGVIEIRHKGDGRLTQGECAGINLAKAPGDPSGPELMLSMVNARWLAPLKQGFVFAAVLKQVYFDGSYEYVVPAGAGEVKRTAPDPDSIRELEPSKSHDLYEVQINQSSQPNQPYQADLGVCAAESPECAPFAVASGDGDFGVYTTKVWYRTTLPAGTEQRFIAKKDQDTTPALWQVAGSSLYNRSLYGDLNAGEYVQPGLGLQPDFEVKLPPVEGLTANKLVVAPNFADVGIYELGLPTIQGRGGPYTPMLQYVDPDFYREVRNPFERMVSPLDNLMFGDGDYIAIDREKDSEARFDWRTNKPAINTLDLRVVNPGDPLMGQYALKLDGTRSVLGRAYSVVCIRRENKDVQAILMQDKVFQLYQAVQNNTQYFVKTHEWFNPEKVPGPCGGTTPSVDPNEIVAQRGLLYEYQMGEGLLLGVEEAVNANFKIGPVAELVHYCWNAACTEPVPGEASALQAIRGPLNHAQEPVYEVRVGSDRTHGGRSYLVGSRLTAYAAGASEPFVDVSLSYQDMPQITKVVNQKNGNEVFNYRRSPFGTQIQVDGQADQNWDSVIRLYSQPCEPAKAGKTGGPCSYVQVIGQSGESTAFEFKNPASRLAQRKIEGAKARSWQEAYGSANGTPPFRGAITDYIYDTQFRIVEERYPTTAAPEWNDALGRWVLPSGGSKSLIAYATKPSGTAANDGRPEGSVSSTDLWPSTYPADYSSTFQGSNATATEQSRWYACSAYAYANVGPSKAWVPTAGVGAFVPTQTNLANTKCDSTAFGTSTGGVLYAAKMAVTSPNSFETSRTGLGSGAQKSTPTYTRYGVKGGDTLSELGKVAGWTFEYPRAVSYSVLGQVSQDDYKANKYADGSRVGVGLEMNPYLARPEAATSEFGATTNFEYDPTDPTRVMRVLPPGVDDTTQRPEMLLTRSPVAGGSQQFGARFNSWSKDASDPNGVSYRPYTVPVSMVMDPTGRITSTTRTDLLAGPVTNRADYRGKLRIRKLDEGQFGYAFYDYATGQVLGSTANMLSDPTQAAGTTAGCNSSVCYPNLAALPDSKARIDALRTFMDENAVSQVFEYDEVLGRIAVSYQFGKYGKVIRVKPAYNRFGLEQGSIAHEVPYSSTQVETDTSRMIGQLDPHIVVTNPTNNGIKTVQTTLWQATSPTADYRKQVDTSEQKDLFNFEQTSSSGQSAYGFADIKMFTSYTANLRITPPANGSSLPAVMNAVGLPLNPSNPSLDGMTWVGFPVDTFDKEARQSETKGTLTDNTNPKNSAAFVQTFKPSTRQATLAVTQCAAGTNCATFTERQDQTTFYKNGSPSQLQRTFFGRGNSQMVPATVKAELSAGMTRIFTDSVTTSGQTARVTALVDPNTGVPYGTSIYNTSDDNATTREYLGYASGASGVAVQVAVADESMQGAGQVKKGTYPQQYLVSNQMYQQAENIFTSGDRLDRLRQAVAIVQQGGQTNRGPVSVNREVYLGLGDARQDTPVYYSQQGEVVDAASGEAPSSWTQSAQVVYPNTSSERLQVASQGGPAGEVTSVADGSRAITDAQRVDGKNVRWTVTHQNDLKEDSAGRLINQIGTTCDDLSGSQTCKQMSNVSYVYGTAVAQQFNVPDEITISSPGFFGSQVMSIKMKYDGEGRPTEITGRGQDKKEFGVVREYNYLETGSTRLKTAKVGGLDTLTYKYGDFDRLAQVDLKTESQSFTVFQTAVDRADKLVKVNQWSATGSRTYTRNQNLVIKVDDGGNWDPFPSQTFDLDVYGNRKNVGGPMQAGNQPTFNGTTKYSNSALVERDENYTYERDGYNRVTRFVSPTAGVSYSLTYDGFGRVATVLFNNPQDPSSSVQRQYIYAGSTDTLLGFVALGFNESTKKLVAQRFVACIRSGAEPGCVGLLQNTEGGTYLNYNYDKPMPGLVAGQRRGSDYTVGMQVYYAYGLQGSVKVNHTHGEMPVMLYPGMITIDFMGPEGDAGKYLITPRGVVYRTDRMVYDQPVGYPTAPYMMQY